MSRYYDEKYIDKISNLHLPRYQDFPNIDLYIDQLLNYIDDQLDFLPLEDGERLLTTSMVNNYVKQGVIEPTLKKKYAKHHIAYLIVVCILKHIYTIKEISALIELQTKIFPLETAYDYFCTEVENAVAAVFLSDCTPTPDSASKTTPLTDLIRSAVFSFANKLYVQKCLQFDGDDYLNITYK